MSDPKGLAQKLRTVFLGRDRDFLKALHLATADTLDEQAARIAALEAAGRALLIKLDAIQDALKQQAILAAVHGAMWPGPTFGEEREALRALLAPEAKETP